MREQRVSSYYAALCLSKNTQAAPWQLTTHSQLSNAAEPPKRPLFNVTRWHCVMQAKHFDMICWDSLLKRKYCTCGGQRCAENRGRVCHELDMKWSPPCFCAQGCFRQVPLVWDFSTSFVSWFILSYKITNIPPRQPHKCIVTAMFYLYEWKLKRWCQTPMLNHHLRIIWKQGMFCVMGFLKGSARLGYTSWQGFGTSQAERGPSTVTIVTLAHHAGISGKSLK